MLGQQIQVDARLVIVAFEEALGDERREVAIPDEVGGKQRNVRLFAHGPVEAPAGRDIRLAADDRGEFGVPGGVVELHRPVHNPVVGQRDGWGAILGGSLAKAVDPARPVQERVFRVHVKMDELTQ